MDVVAGHGSKKQITTHAPTSAPAPASTSASASTHVTSHPSGGSGSANQKSSKVATMMPFDEDVDADPYETCMSSRFRTILLPDD